MKRTTKYVAFGVHQAMSQGASLSGLPHCERDMCSSATGGAGGATALICTASGCCGLVLGEGGALRLPPTAR
jgi:hypothetical protein